MPTTTLKPPPPPKNEVLFRIIKIIDIAYIAVLYFVIAYVLGYYIDNYFLWLYGADYDTKSNMILSLEVLSQIIVIAITVYIGRNIVELIPFPLDGINGFIHSACKRIEKRCIHDCVFGDVPILYAGQNICN